MAAVVMEKRILLRKTVVEGGGVGLLVVMLTLLAMPSVV